MFGPFGEGFDGPGGTPSPWPMPPSSTQHS